MCEIEDDMKESKFELHSLISEGVTKELPPEKVKAFIDENNCNVNLADDDGVTPLHEAAQGGLYEIVKLLIDYGANINAQNKSGWTPLIEASFVNSIYWVGEGMLDTVKVLMENGADKSIKCKDGKTARDYAKEIYFDRSIYYYLSDTPDDDKYYPNISSQMMGKFISLKFENDIRYCIANYELEECDGGTVLQGIISQICDSVQFDKSDDPFCYGSHPSRAILRVYETNEEGVRTWKYYQFHHDDVEIEINDSPRLFDDISSLTGFNVEIRPKLQVPIFYQFGNLIKTLYPDDRFTGYFQQMTVRQLNNCFERVHIRDQNGNEAIFFSDEISVKSLSLRQN